MTVDKWSPWRAKSHLSLGRARWCFARFHSSSGWSCLSSLWVFPCSAGAYSSAPPLRHFEVAWALCPDLMSWGSLPSLPPGVGPSVCPHQSPLPGPHEAGPPQNRSRRGGAAAYRRWLGGVWVIWSWWACQVGLLWQCCSSGLGFVYVMNEILHMLLFIELLRCHTPGVSSEPVMGSGYMSSCGNILQHCIIGHQHVID